MKRIKLITFNTDIETLTQGLLNKKFKNIKIMSACVLIPINEYNNVIDYLKELSIDYKVV